jgi:MATE family multidrug resistance protein
MLSASVMTLVDTFFVSRLGTWALAGVGLGGIVSFAIVCFPIGSLGAVKILASQSVGAGRPENIGRYLGAGLALAGIMTGLAFVLASGVAEFIHHAAASVETGNAARTYIQIGAFGILPMLARVAIEQIRLAQGDTRSPMYVAVFSNACNVGFNYWFIVVLELGVAGAAYGTLAANVVGCLAMTFVQTRHGFRTTGTRLQDLASIWRLGLPTGLQMLLEMGAFTMMVLMLTNLSDIDGAANQIAIQIIHFGFLPCMAVAEAASIMVGQAVGANRRDLVHVVTRGALLPIFGFAIFIAIVFVAAGPWIAAQFSVDSELIALTVRLLYVAALFQFADGLSILCRSVLRGAGDVRFCAIFGVLISWGLTPPLTWFFGYHLGLGALGGWFGLCLEIVVGASVFWWRLRSNRWHHSADLTTSELAR